MLTRLCHHLRSRLLGTAFRQELLAFLCFLFLCRCSLSFTSFQRLIRCCLKLLFPAHPLRCRDKLRGYIFWGNIPCRYHHPALHFVCLLPCLGFLCTFYFSEIFPFFDIFWLISFAFSMFVCFLCGR